MISLEEVQKYTQQIPEWFYPEEIHSMYHMVVGLPDHATIVEVGVCYGRSASIYLQIGEHKPLNIYLVDSYDREDSKLAKASCLQLIRMIGPDLHRGSSLHTNWVPSVQAAEGFPVKGYPDKIDLLHIDADHSYEAVKADCEAWLPKMKSGGLACFHDYGVSRTGVQQAVEEYCDPRGWEKVEPQYRTLHVRRVP